MADPGEEIIDTRIKDELDGLNSAANSINKLENEVQRARATFKVLKEDCTQDLMACSRRVTKQNIIRSKEYYELLKYLIKIQGEVQKTTQKYQKANSVYKAALETVGLAEEQLVGEDGARVMFDAAWQEMLNHSNLRFSEAEKEKRLCEVEHSRWSREFDALKNKLSTLHRNNAKAIFKSKPFYEMKRKFESKLQAERQNAEDLQLALVCNKQKYRMALNNLERISEELHQQRELRTPGVGAESDACSDLSDSLNFNFDFLSDTSSQVSSGDLAEFDSDLTFMEDWTEIEEQSIFSKVSTRFNRSTSLSNLGDRHRLSLNAPPQQLPQSPLTTPQSIPTFVPSPQPPPNFITKSHPTAMTTIQSQPSINITPAQHPLPKSPTAPKPHPPTKSSTNQKLSRDFTPPHHSKSATASLKLCPSSPINARKHHLPLIKSTTTQSILTPINTAKHRTTNAAYTPPPNVSRELTLEGAEGKGYLESTKPSTSRSFTSSAFLRISANGVSNKTAVPGRNNADDIENGATVERLHSKIASSSDGNNRGNNNNNNNKVMASNNKKVVVNMASNFEGEKEAMRRGDA